MLLTVTDHVTTGVVSPFSPPTVLISLVSVVDVSGAAPLLLVATVACQVLILHFPKTA